MNNKEYPEESIFTVSVIAFLGATVMTICPYCNVSNPVKQAMMKATVEFCYSDFLLCWKVVTQMSRPPSHTGEPFS